MKKILITGAGSFIGNAVKQHLDRFEGAYETHMLSLRSDAWKQADFSRYDCILHAAGIAHVSPKPELEEAYRRVNRDLAIECARKAKADGAGQFIFLSSMIVYGGASKAGKRRIIDANTLPTPENAYGLSKLEAEKGIWALQEDTFRTAIVRPPMVYGRGCRGNYNMLSRWVGKIPFFPDFPGMRSVICIDNLAEFIRLLIDANDAGIFHPQDANVTTSAAIAREIALARGEKLHLVRIFNPLIRIFGGISIVKRAFGDMQYDPALSSYPWDYRICTLSEAITKTEHKGDDPEWPA